MTAHEPGEGHARYRWVSHSTHIWMVWPGPSKGSGACFWPSGQQVNFCVQSLCSLELKHVCMLRSLWPKPTRKLLPPCVCYTLSIALGHVSHLHKSMEQTNKNALIAGAKKPSISPLTSTCVPFDPRHTCSRAIRLSGSLAKTWWWRDVCCCVGVFGLCFMLGSGWCCVCVYVCCCVLFGLYWGGCLLVWCIYVFMCVVVWLVT